MMQIGEIRQFSGSRFEYLHAKLIQDRPKIRHKPCHVLPARQINPRCLGGKFLIPDIGSYSRAAQGGVTLPQGTMIPLPCRLEGMFHVEHPPIQKLPPSARSTLH